MKKTLLALLSVMFVSSLCFAQQPSAPASQDAPKLLETKTFAGKVEWVTLGDPANKNSSRITVVDESGKSLSLELKTATATTAATTITGKDGNAITLDAIARDSKVVVEYAVSKKGINKAKSIKLVE